MPYLGRGSDNGFSIRNRYIFTATANQQNFSGADANSNTLALEDGFLTDVFVNGIMLKPTTDYTLNNSTNTLSLVSAADANEEVTILVYQIFALSDAMPTSGGTFSGGITGTTANFSGNITGTLATASQTNITSVGTLTGLTVDQNTSGQMVASFEGLNGRVHIGRYGHILQQNTDDSTTEFWSTATRFDGSFSIAFGTSSNEGTVASSDNIISITQAGVTSFAGNVNVTGNVEPTGSVRVDDNQYFQAGNSYDLQMYHDGSNSYVEDQGTGDLRIKGSVVRILSDAINLSNSANNEDYITCAADGAVKLTFNGTTQLATQTNGINLHNTTVSGNPANAKFIIDSSSQYDGIALGSGASSAVIGRHSNGAGMHFTANSAPANMGGGAKAGFVFSSGSSGGSSPVDILQINTDGRVRIGSGSPETGVQLEINALDNHAISARSNGGNGNNRRFNLTPFASGGTYGGGFILETRNSSNIFSEAMRFGFDGSLRLQHVYDDTTSNSANMYIHSDGVHQVMRSTSSERYKKNIETLEDKYADAVLGLRPVWYKSKCEADNPDYSHWGLIAEEVAKVDPRLVTFRTEITKRYRDLKTEEEVVETTKLDEPQAESVQYDRFIPHLINICKRQEDKITALEAKVKALEEA